LAITGVIPNKTVTDETSLGWWGLEKRRKYSNHQSFAGAKTSVEEVTSLRIFP
jgi:hypothetical protein